MDASSAQSNCAGKFGSDYGRLFEPKSLAMYQSVYDKSKALGHPSRGSYFTGHTGQKTQELEGF